MRRFLERGLRFGLGTDSEISVAPPDLLAEARAAQQLTGWTNREAVRALTLGGAEAIERAHECGSLAPGKWADLMAVAAVDVSDPEAAVLAAGPESVVGTWIGGREVHRVTDR